VPAHSTVCLGCSVVRSEVCSFRCQHFSIRFSRCSRLSIDFPVVGFTGLVFSCSFSSVLARARPVSSAPRSGFLPRCALVSRSSCSRGQRARSNFWRQSAFASLGFQLARFSTGKFAAVSSPTVVPTRIARRPHRSFPRVSFSCSRQKGAGQFSSPWSSRSVFAQA
jgi:hypothetical protein